MTFSKSPCPNSKGTETVQVHQARVRRNNANRVSMSAILFYHEINFSTRFAYPVGWYPVQVGRNWTWELAHSGGFWYTQSLLLPLSHPFKFLWASHSYLLSRCSVTKTWECVPNNKYKPPGRVSLRSLALYILIVPGDFSFLSILFRHFPCGRIFGSC